MQPDNQPPNYENYSIDYLNEISRPTKPQRQISSTIFMVGIGILFLVAVVLLIVAITSGPKSVKEQAADLYVRMQALDEISQKQHKKLRSNVIRSYDSSMRLQLKTAQRDIETYFEDKGTDIKKYTKKKKLSPDELVKSLNSKFEEAELNIMLDRTYALEMAYQMSLIKNSIASIKRRDSSSKSIDDLAANSQASFRDLSNKFATFRSSS